MAVVVVVVVLIVVVNSCGSSGGGGSGSSISGSSGSSCGGSSSGGGKSDCGNSGGRSGCSSSCCCCSYSSSRKCSGKESSCSGSSYDHPFFHVDIRYYGKLLKYVKITLVEAGNAVLAVFDEALQNEAMRKLTGIHHTYTYSISYTQSFISESLGKRCTWDDRWLWYCCRRNPPNRGIHRISHWISLVQELADTLASAANTYRH